MSVLQERVLVETQRRLDRVMNYVRRDGPLDAPVCFLTIEDGGDFEDDSVGDFMAKRFQHEYEASEPKTRDERSFGARDKPAQFMAKLMLAIFRGNTDDWRDYRADLLTLKNEANIKFYPIPRKRTSKWHEVFTEAIGLSESEYIARCRAERPVIIYNRWNPLFQPDRLHVILGARAEWAEFLMRFVYTDAQPCSPVRDEGGRTKYAIYCQPDKSLAFASFDVFRPGCRNDDVTDFAAALRPLLSDAVKRRVSL